MSVEKLKVSLGVYDAQWEANLELYKAFKAEYGREPLATESYRGCRLGAWCNTQRVWYRTSRLYEDRFEKLTSAGFGFEHYDPRWENNLALYVAFKAEYGREPAQKEIYQGVKIGSWCTEQRKAYQSDRLSAERVQRLRDVGFEFNVREAAWQEVFVHYTAFIAERGRLPVVRAEQYEERSLARWAIAQRAAFRAGKLSVERQKALAEIGFDFVGRKPLDDSLEERLQDAAVRSGAPQGESKPSYELSK